LRSVRAATTCYSAFLASGGPYLETKEHIASLYLLECDSEERAHQIAAEMPWADIEPG
jgi:hypothetical protein